MQFFYIIGLKPASKMSLLDAGKSLTAEPHEDRNEPIATKFCTSGALLD